jgi:RNA polymerase sigma-70 factor (ECF subfamily)
MWAANNLMVDRRRRNLRAMRRDRDWAETGAPADEKTSESSTERFLIGRDVLAQAESVLASLGERTEAVFRRHRLDEVRIDQVAREFGVSRSTVEKELQKAYRALLEFRRSEIA